MNLIYCNKNKDGWYCTRLIGHSGPCAAIKSVGLPEITSRPLVPRQEPPKSPGFYRPIDIAPGEFAKEPEPRLKMSIESFGTEYATSMNCDANVDECVRAFVNLMVSAGYSRKNLVDLFIDGDPNNWESAWGDN